ncbi:MAG: alkyl sulfatase dimerization domain-containing protein, partial [Microbacterium pygmaeum]
THGYYGSVSHNVKAIYQRYMGWYDGNPARLWKHTPTAAAERYVRFMGGAEAVVANARTSYGEGDYRWVAEVLDHVVFAEPDHAEAKALLADALEQLGFGSENGTWRSVYLSGAMELRTGNFGSVQSTVSLDILKSLSIPQFFDAFAIQIDGPKAWDIDSSVAWIFTDTGERYRTTLRNGVLVYVEGSEADSDVTVSLPHAAILPLAAGSLEAARAAGLTMVGDETALTSVFSVLSPGDPAFDIVTP